MGRKQAQISINFVILIVISIICTTVAEKNPTALDPTYEQCLGYCYFICRSSPNLRRCTDDCVVDRCIPPKLGSKTR
ncbi:hypothetical protein ACP275_09G110800 [Erythranthe tilingii]